MKKIIFLIIIIIAGYYFFTSSPDSRAGAFKNHALEKLDSLASIGKSKADYEEELRAKTAELEAYEAGRQKMEEDFVKMEANLPTCPKTGQKAVFIEKPKVPQEVIDKIDKLKAEIAVLKTKV